jgi:hypothetical protein
MPIRAADYRGQQHFAEQRPPGVSQTRTHAAAHELTALTTGGTTSPLSYDPKGNLLSRPASLASPALGLAHAGVAVRGPVNEPWPPLLCFFSTA